jgi:hypothetical protein
LPPLFSIGQSYRAPSITMEAGLRKITVQPNAGSTYHRVQAVLDRAAETNKARGGYPAFIAALLLPL